MLKNSGDNLLYMLSCMRGFYVLSLLACSLSMPISVTPRLRSENGPISTCKIDRSSKFHVMFSVHNVALSDKMSCKNKVTVVIKHAYTENGTWVWR